MSFIEPCSRESGLHLQLVTDEPNAFNSFMAHYGNFSGVRNYIVLAGKKEKGKTVFQLDPGEKLCLVIAVGYGTSEGGPHKTKPRESVMHTEQTPPDWFLRGIDAALLAPTAMNQQKFVFSLKGNTVTAKAGIGFYSKIDLGIAKYHFELGR